MKKDNSKLSKNKYIYRIYSSQDNVVHCTKHAIIYINSNYLYYKVNAKGALQCIDSSKIAEKFDKGDTLKAGWAGWINNFYYEVNGFNSTEMTDSIFKSKKQRKVDSLESSIKLTESRMKKLKEELKEAQEQIAPIITEDEGIEDCTEEE